MTSKVEVTRQHSQLLKGVYVWLEQQESTTPLELGVFADIMERIENHTLHGAYVRVRIKNLGTPASKRKTWENGDKKNRRWTSDDCDTLRRLFYEGLTHEAIGERMGRTTSSIAEKVGSLELKRTRPRNTTGNNMMNHPARDILTRARQRRLDRVEVAKRDREEGAA